MRLPGLNDYVNRNRQNRFLGNKLKNDTEQGISLFIRVAKLEEITEPCFFTFIWHEKTRKRDKDNVAFAKKFIFDALQRTGKLPNDNNKFVIGFSDYFVYDKTQKVEVIMETIDEQKEIIRKEIFES